MEANPGLCGDLSFDWIGHHVKIRLVDSPNEVEGRVYSIDPESGAWLLTTGAENQMNLDGPLCAVFPAAITSIERSPNTVRLVVPSIEEVLDAGGGGSQDAVTAGSSKDDLLALLSQHHLPATEEEDDVVRVLGTVTIHPPYRSQDCRCSNEIMLRRVQGMLVRPPQPG